MKKALENIINKRNQLWLLLQLGVFLCLLTGTFSSQAQDIHFSQTSFSPLNLNPAETGMFKGNKRAFLNYRNQWATVSVPFKTYSASYEQNFYLPFSWAGLLGVGAVINADVAGDANFGIKQAKLSLAYHRFNFIENHFDVSLGMNIGFNQYSLDYSKLRFSQDDMSSCLSANFNSLETNINPQFSFLDFSFGSRMQYHWEGISFCFGVAFSHINNSKKSFYKRVQDPIHSKFNSYLESKIPIDSKWLIQPAIYYFHQAKAQSINIGALAQKKTEHPDFKYYFFGLFNRHNDAVCFIIGTNYKGLQVGLSYDLTYSSLNSYKKNVGALEISLHYLFHKKVNKKELQIHPQCPIFI